MLSRKLLDKMYEELHNANRTIQTLQETNCFPDAPGVVEVHGERIRSAICIATTIDLLIDIYLSDQ